MNKLMTGILASTIATFSTTAAVSTYATETSNTLYGDFRYSLNYVDTTTDSLSTDDNATRMGLKGSLSGEGDLQAFYHLQYSANVDGNDDGNAFNKRFFLAGLKGDFGKVVYGRTSTAYKMAGLKLDPFYDTSAGAGFGGANYGLSPLTNSWTDDTLAYTSPKLGGSIVLNGAIYIDDTQQDEHDYNVGATFSSDAITAGVQVASIGDTGVIANSTVVGVDSTAIRAHASFTAGPLKLGLSAEQIDVDGAADEQQYLYLSATYQANDALRFAASFGQVEDAGAADGDGFTVGAFYKLLKKTEVYALASSVDMDNGSERQTISFGISQKFSISHKGTY